MSRVLEFAAVPGKPVLKGNDHYWAVILDLDRRGTWTVADILGQCGGGVISSTIRDFVRRLVAGGIAQYAGTEELRMVAFYRLLNRPIETPCLRRDGTAGLQGRGQTQMWNVMRGPLGRQGFTTAELALYASTGPVPVKAASAASYVKHLAAAGYFITVRKGRRGAPAVYRLKPAMSGRLPPLILRSQFVFDQNRQTSLAPVSAREVAP